MIRTDGRQPGDMRPVKITRDYIPHAEGSVLMELGHTRVICTVSYDDTVPGFLKGSGRGWVTAEYSMLPRATSTRSTREAAKGRQGGRTMEIQRLIGRSLRAVTDMKAMGEKTLLVDCDVIEADGGTRTASITGAFVALKDAVDTLMDEGLLARSVITGHVAAVSVGVISGEPILDLCFEEDFHADMDLNIVAMGDGGIVEIQGTAEHQAISREMLDGLVDLGLDGVTRLVELQKQALAETRRRDSA